MKFFVPVIAVLVLASAGCAAKQSSSASSSKHAQKGAMHKWIDQQARSPVKPASAEYLDLNKNGKKDAYEDPNLPIERRIDDLLAQMNLDEKTCQLATLYGFGRVLQDELPTPQWKQKIWKDGVANIDEHLSGYVGGRGIGVPAGLIKDEKNVWPASNHARAINEVQKWFIEQTRLGIPVDFSAEGIRGIAHLQATCFPNQNGMGSTFNRALIRRQGEITGGEGRALGYTSIYAPILDPMRDQRWGRNEDSYGESPYLVAELGIQLIQGIQSQGAASAVKHYTIYSQNKGAREGPARTDPQVAPREVEDVFVYPFKRAFLEAKAMGAMSSYNDYDGIPITGSRYWLTERLRHEFGFTGYVVSDSDAVEFIWNKHHVAADMKGAVREAAMAGMNVRCTFWPPDQYILPLRELVKEGAVPMRQIDHLVRDVLRTKFRLGLFDRPYVDPDRADKVVMTAENLAVALQASRESIVLLKNDKKALPLKKTLKKVAVVGPNADEKGYALTRYGPYKVPVTTVLAGVREKLKSSGADVVYAKGCEFTDPTWPVSEILPQPISDKEQKQIDEAVAAARGADVAIVVLGDNTKTSGEHRSRTSLELPGRQLDLIKAIHATGTPTVLVLINGRPIAINWPAEKVPAIVCAWYPGAQGGAAIADVLFGDYNPGGKLANTWPKHVGQIPMNFPTKPSAQKEDDKHANVSGALYNFGHGLSYTTFEYSNLHVRAQNGKVPTTPDNVLVEVDVKNIGKLSGDEVVQLYVRDLVSSVTTYEQKLGGFERVALKPAERKTITFVVRNDDLTLINRDGKRVVEPGEFRFSAGSSSADIRQDATIEIVGPNGERGPIEPKSATTKPNKTGADE
ncbi:MAG: beta-glucosidase [Phycisphaerales bacterium]|jgi:beta-glucosidase|nr:beta-glucosidase [Phycisphaerales bacterium]